MLLLELNNDVLAYISTFIGNTDTLLHLQITCKIFHQIITKFLFTKSILNTKFTYLNKKYDAIEKNKFKNHLICVDAECYIHRIHHYSLGNIYFYHKNKRANWDTIQDFIHVGFKMSYYRRFIPYCKYCTRKYMNFDPD
jgi:hypothetical protein